MQKKGVNEQVIRSLMGQKRDTYSEWKNRYDELLEIYRSSRPTLDQKEAVADIVEYAKSRGYSLDPKCLARDIRADQVSNSDNSGGAEASKASYCSQKREANVILVC